MTLEMEQMHGSVMLTLNHYDAKKIVERYMSGQGVTDPVEQLMSVLARGCGMEQEFFEQMGFDETPSREEFESCS